MTITINAIPQCRPGATIVVSGNLDGYAAPPILGFCGIDGKGMSLPAPSLKFSNLQRSSVQIDITPVKMQYTPLPVGSLVDRAKFQFNATAPNASGQHTVTVVDTASDDTATATFTVAVVSSPDQTLITGTNGVIYDYNGNRWRINTAARVVVNNVVDTRTSNVDLLYWYGGRVYHRNKLRTWYYITAPGGSWTLVQAPITPATIQTELQAIAPVLPDPNSQQTLQGTIRKVSLLQP